MNQPVNWANGQSEGKLYKFATFFLYLIMLSKISLSAFGMPQRISVFIFQGGIHPYVHILICLIAGPIFLLMARKKILKAEPNFHPWYKIWLTGLCAILAVQTVLQMALLGQGIMAIAALGAAYLLIAIYGIAIPKILPLEDMMTKTFKICLIIILISLVAKLIGTPEVYKGNRFIGVFKHIPHMVSCASLGFVFLLNSWQKRVGVGPKMLFILYLGIFSAVIVLTGTRSAFFACVFALGLFFTFLKSNDDGFQMGKMLVGWIVILAVVLFGAVGFQYAVDVATGKASLGNRDAQNGVEERLEEIERGKELFEKSPYLGLGLLSKFGAAEDGGTDGDMVDSYNSFADPHNIFLSAAVVGGWPLAIWVTIGVILLSLATLKAIWIRQTPYLTLGVYMAGHLPIMIIYHIHLSIGGIADRYYWLAFGYLALLRKKSGVRHAS